MPDDNAGVGGSPIDALCSGGDDDAEILSHESSGKDCRCRASSFALLWLQDFRLACAAWIWLGSLPFDYALRMTRSHCVFSWHHRYVWSNGDHANLDLADHVDFSHHYTALGSLLLYRHAIAVEYSSRALLPSIC
jgi:hypothetical protein